MGHARTLTALVYLALAVLAAASVPMSTISAHEAHAEAMKLARANNLEAALPFFKHAATRSPQSPAYLNNVGVTLMRLNRYSEALEVFDKALSLDPMHADASDNIADLRRLWRGFPIGWRPGAAAAATAEDTASGTAEISPTGGLTVTLPAPTVPGSGAGNNGGAGTSAGAATAGALSLSNACSSTTPCSTTPPEPLPPATTAMLSTAASSPTAAAAATATAAATAAEAARDRLIPTHWHPSDRVKFTRRNTNPRQLLPRLTVADLDKPENRLFRLGRLPFVLTPAPGAPPFVRAREAGAAGGNSWDPTGLGKRFPHAIGDYYPVNMAAPDNKPYLTPLPKAAQELRAPSSAYPAPHPDFPGRYVQWNVRPREWQQLMGDAVGIPPMFREDSLWLTHCLGSAQATGAVPDPATVPSPSQSARAAADGDDAALIDEFTSKLHWRMVLLGTEGAGMFNHYDVLPTASYQVQVLGAKRWHICAPDQRAFLYGVKNGVDTFYPNYARYPGFTHARCYEDVVTAGEIVFYPRGYWHQTENLATPSVAVSSSVVGGDSWRQVADTLAETCRSDPYRWSFSAQLCTALRERCVPLWDRMYGAQGKVHSVRQAQGQQAQGQGQAQGRGPGAQ